MLLCGVTEIWTAAHRVASSSGTSPIGASGVQPPLVSSFQKDGFVPPSTAELTNEKVNSTKKRFIFFC